jgi:hypothetical protein
MGVSSALKNPIAILPIKIVYIHKNPLAPLLFSPIENNTHKNPPLAPFAIFTPFSVIFCRFLIDFL